jgi:high-affinity K+ transport system ATPase subunit B
MFDRTSAAGIGLLVLLAVATVVLGASASRPIAPTPPNAGGDAGSTTGLGARIADAATEARGLVALGERRSRNLLEIRAAQRRMEEKLAAVDALTAARSASDADVAALAEYRRGATDVRDAMAEAQAGLLRFDWDRVARAYRRMGSGAEHLASAARRLGVPLSATPPPAETLDSEAVAGRRFVRRSLLALGVL